MNVHNKMLPQDAVTSLADLVQDSQARPCAIPRLTESHPAMTIADGYAVQSELRRRLSAAGHRIVGWKAGLTSKAKMVQMGVNVPAIGFLTSQMASPEGEAVAISTLIHPRVECEIAFVTSAELKGPDCTARDVLAATDCVLAAIEVIDSRFSGFKFDLPSVLADNCSSARFVIGGRARYAGEVDLRTIGTVLEKNGEIAGLAAGAAVMEHPAEAVALVVNVLASLGETLPAGSLVLSGGMTEAIPVAAGDVITARFQDLGSVSMRFVA